MSKQFYGRTSPKSITEPTVQKENNVFRKVNLACDSLKKKVLNNGGWCVASIINRTSMSLQLLYD